MHKTCWILLITICSLSAAYARTREMTVQVREAQLRTAPSFLSQIRERIPYTQRVNILEERGDWLHVQTQSSQNKGWMHQSSLTQKKLTLTAGEQQATQSVTTDEQALAGKGFNAQVEAEFRKRNADAAFALVDKMEQRTVTPQAIQIFLIDGGLISPDANQEEK